MISESKLKALKTAVKFHVQCEKIFQKDWGRRLYSAEVLDETIQFVADSLDLSEASVRRYFEKALTSK